jgi:hypothetical protein
MFLTLSWQENFVIARSASDDAIQRRRKERLDRFAFARDDG